MINQMMLSSFVIIFSFQISLILCINKNDLEYSKMIELNENNWEEMLNDEWMVEFFAPWCPACKSLTPTWERYAVSAGKYKVHVAKIDVTQSPSLSGRFFVTALPTIYHVFNGEFRQYRGPRNEESLLEYIKDKQWTKVEPLSSWKQPNSIHMSILSKFFKVSHFLKDVNNFLYVEYGIPIWGSYALFASGTILFGAILGLFLVCVVDFLYPPKRMLVKRNTIEDTDNNGQGDVGAVEDIVGDELEDDNDDDDDGDDDKNEGDTKNKKQNDENDSTSEGEKNSDEDSDDNDNKDDDVENEKNDLNTNTTTVPASQIVNRLNKGVEKN